MSPYDAKWDQLMDWIWVFQGREMDKNRYFLRDLANLA